jgi:hypothetical protein
VSILILSLLLKECYVNLFFSLSLAPQSNTERLKCDGSFDVWLSNTLICTDWGGEINKITPMIHY